MPFTKPHMLREEGVAAWNANCNIRAVSTASSNYYTTRGGVRSARNRRVQILSSAATGRGRAGGGSNSRCNEILYVDGCVGSSTPKRRFAEALARLAVRTR